MFAPFLAPVMRMIVMWLVFAIFKMFIRWLNGELVQPVKRERIRRASARILVEDEKHWGESESHAIVRYKFDHV